MRQPSRTTYEGSRGSGSGPNERSQLAYLGVPGDDKFKTAQAFTVTIDINDFSKQTVDSQLAWYMHLRMLIAGVLDDLDIQIADSADGAAFWSRGGDGGTLSIVEGGAAIAMRFALQTASELNRHPLQADRGGPFEVTIGIDRGLIHIGPDLNGSPNVWGDAINNSNRISSTCDPGQILASEAFIDDLRSQTRDMDSYVDRNYLDPEKRRSQKRLAKHGRFFKVVNVYSEKDHIGQAVSGEVAIHVADFEAPFAEMVRNYRDHLAEVVRARSGVWTLLLARRLYDIGELSKSDFSQYVQMVSSHGEYRDPDHPRDPFFSSFGQTELLLMMRQGRFKRLASEEILCRQGDVGDELYIIARGRLDIRVGETVVMTRETGEMVGEMAMVEPGTLTLRDSNPVRTAGMVARGDLTVFAIPYDSVRDAASSSHEVLTAFVRSYRERQKENAVSKAQCLRQIDQPDKAFLRAEGRLEGLQPGHHRTIECTTEVLLVCCHGRVHVHKGQQQAVCSRREDGSMEALWIPDQVNASERHLSIEAETNSEVVLWRGETWQDWLRRRSGQNLGARLAETCESMLS